MGMGRGRFGPRLQGGSAVLAGSTGLLPADKKGQWRWDKTEKKVSPDSGLSTGHGHTAATMGLQGAQHPEELGPFLVATLKG